jgi:hypothetical protein
MFSRCREPPHSALFLETAKARHQINSQAISGKQVKSASLDNQLSIEYRKSAAGALVPWNHVFDHYTVPDLAIAPY